jgi:hypothetical protein
MREKQTKISNKQKNWYLQGEFEFKTAVQKLFLKDGI